MAPKLKPDYRIRFAITLLRIYVPPLLGTFVLLSLFGVKASVLPLLTVTALWPMIMMVYSQWLYKKQAESLGARPIPCVRGKWIGNLDILLRIMRGTPRGYIVQRLEDLFEEYGSTTLNTRILWQDQIISMDETHIKCALQSKFDEFEKGYLFAEKMETFLGNGIFNRDGDEWKMHRAKLRPFFAKERISDFDIFETHAEKTISLLNAISSQGLAIDIQDLFLRFTMDTATEFLFGTNSDTLSKPLPEQGKAKLGPKGSLTEDEFGSFAKAFDEVQLVMSARFLMGEVWPLVELFKDRSGPPVKTIMEWTRPMVEEAMSEKRATGNNVSGPQATTLLGHLVDSIDDAETIQFQLLNILMAARDTTAGTLTFMLYFLCLNPDVTTRLRDEILGICGKHGKPSAQAIRDMKYLRAVLNETLRIFPPVAVGVRTTEAAPVTLPDAKGGKPFFMPGKTSFMILTTGLHRRKDLWGEDGDDFNPDRWIDPNRKEKIMANPAMFIPFFEGPRVCPGQDFAYNEASYLLIKLLQNYKNFSLAPQYQPEGSSPPEEWKDGPGRQAIEKCWPAQAFTLFSKGGLWLRATPASDSE